MRTLIAIAVVLMALLLAADAHDHNRPELDEWFRGLQAQSGASCCDGSDAFSVVDPDWDTTADPDWPYKVKFKGAWLKVHKSAVVPGPNKAGPAKVWPVEDEEDGTTSVRCFLPGAGA